MAASAPRNPGFESSRTFEGMEFVSIRVRGGARAMKTDTHDEDGLQNYIYLVLTIGPVQHERDTDSKK
jgi:hypothetical protein